MKFLILNIITILMDWAVLYQSLNKTHTQV